MGALSGPPPHVVGRRAGFWIRSVAALIDLIALLAMVAGAALALEVMGVVDDAAVARVIQWTLYGGLFLYSTTEIWTAGTPGKLLLGLRITALDGSRADPWRRVLRWSTKQFWLILFMAFLLTDFGLLYPLAGFSSLVVTIGCFYAANDDHLSWHDQWAATAVCYRRRQYQSFPIAPPALSPTSSPTARA